MRFCCLIMHLAITAVLGRFEFDDNFFQARVSESLLVIFLPPNMTSAIQPMDMGIIASFRAHYRRFFLKKKIQDIDADIEETKLTILGAAQLTARAWSKISDKTIRNCFRTSGILPVTHRAECNIENRYKLKGVDDALLDDLAECMKLLSTNDDAMTVEVFVCADEEAQAEEGVTDKSVINEALRSQGVVAKVSGEVVI